MDPDLRGQEGQNSSTESQAVFLPSQGIPASMLGGRKSLFYEMGTDPVFILKLAVHYGFFFFALILIFKSLTLKYSSCD